MHPSKRDYGYSQSIVYFKYKYKSLDLVLNFNDYGTLAH